MQELKEEYKSSMGNTADGSKIGLCIKKTFHKAIL
jgi:hypothetical protein